MNRNRALVGWALAAAMAMGALAGCANSTTTAPETSTAATSTTTGTTVTGKVSANTASTEEIAAALKAAGVTNSDRWAREVVEYRPYDANDSSLAKLRQNLTKYNPGDDTMTKILGALTP